MNIFESFQKPPVFLAPLAGVSDYPFRKVCRDLGADLTYVEMLSAIALVHGSKSTLRLITVPKDEYPILGVQVTANSHDYMEKAVKILDSFPFKTIDINMGCPVRKVVGSGCGSALLKDPEKVMLVTKAACRATKKPVSVKIRLGWDHNNVNFMETLDAAQSGGAKWITVHGRCRSDRYDAAVRLEAFSEMKKVAKIPVLGNGNLFCMGDYLKTLKYGRVDGLMVSRGALGNPWIFKEFKEEKEYRLEKEEWYAVVKKHLDLQEMFYKDIENSNGAVCMRKHILWYLKGWPYSKEIRNTIGRMNSFGKIDELLLEFMELLEKRGVKYRSPVQEHEDKKFSGVV